MSNAKAVMVKMKSNGFLHHYEEKTDAVNQKKQRDFLVWFRNGLEKPVHVEVKSETYQFINIALELVHDIDNGVHGKHVFFDNDYHLHYFPVDDLAVRFKCHAVRDELLLPLLERSNEFLPTQKKSIVHDGMTLKLAYPRTNIGGVYSHTTCTLIAPKELVESIASSYKVYEFVAPPRPPLS